MGLLKESAPMWNLNKDPFVFQIFLVDFENNISSFKYVQTQQGRILLNVIR